MSEKVYECPKCKCRDIVVSEEVEYRWVDSGYVLLSKPVRVVIKCGKCGTVIHEKEIDLKEHGRSSSGRSGINPERILEKLEEYLEMEKEAQRLRYKLYEARDKLEKLLISWKLEKNLTEAFLDIVLDKVKCSTLEEFEVFLKTVPKYFYGGMARKRVLEFIESLSKCQLKEIYSIYREFQTTFELMRALEKKQKEIFGMLRWEEITLEKLVTMIYKCVKYAMEG